MTVVTIQTFLVQEQLDKILQEDGGGILAGDPTDFVSHTVTEGPGTIGTRIIAKRYPVVEGLEFGTTKQEGKPFLVEEGY